MTLTLRTVHFDAPRKGTNLLVLGAVHGNETCGTKAIERVLPELTEGRLPLLAGSVTFVPVCNPRAFAQGTRYADHNLNRDLRPRDNPQDYEDHLGNLLCPLLERCDYLLDLHSYHSGGPAFIFAGPEGDKETAFRRALGPTAELFGWSAAYARIVGREAHDTTSVGTTEYARPFGATAITLECGHHNDPAAIDVAEKAIRRALIHCGLCEGTAEVFPLRLRVRLENIYWKKDEGRLARDWKHLDAVKAGEPLAFTADGDAITAPTDGFMILPNAACPIGEEWFYFGITPAL